MLGSEVQVTVTGALAEVLATAVKELPFGELVVKLFDQIVQTVQAASRNDQLVVTALEQLNMLQSTVQSILASQFDSFEIFEHYVNVLLEMHTHVKEWQNKGMLGRFWNARTFQAQFDNLFDKLGRATQNLTLCVTVEAKANAEAVFAKFEEDQQKLKATADQILNQVNEQHGDQMHLLKQMHLLLKNQEQILKKKEHIALENQGVIAAKIKRKVQAIDPTSISIVKGGFPLGKGAQGVVRRASMALHDGGKVDVAVKIVSVDEVGAQCNAGTCFPQKRC